MDRPKCAQDIHDHIESIKGGPRLTDLSRSVAEEGNEDIAAVITALAKIELISILQLRTLALILEKFEDG